MLAYYTDFDQERKPPSLLPIRETIRTMSSDSEAPASSSSPSRTRRGRRPSLVRSATLRANVKTIQELFARKGSTISSSCDVRSVQVEHVSALIKNKSLDKDLVDSMVDHPDFNFTPFMVVTSLKDGVFTSEISMKCFPPGEDDIKVRIHNYKLEILVLKGVEGAGSKGAYITQYCGSLALPIFVNPSTIEVSIEPSKDILVIKGYCK